LQPTTEESEIPKTYTADELFALAKEWDRRANAAAAREWAESCRQQADRCIAAGNAMLRGASRFYAMPKAELRAFIDGCHASRQFDATFERACLVFNNRFR
jgi:hypothetical protein